MTTDLEHERELRAIAHALVADAPDVPDWEMVSDTPASRPDTRRWLAGTAAAIVLVGVGGIIVTRSGDEGTSGSEPKSTSTATTPAGTDASDTVDPTEQTYVVVAGDFLSGIAAAHCVSAEALAEYNAWPEGVDAPLFPNDVIRIPPGACRVDAGQAPVAEANSALAPTMYPVVPQNVLGGDSVTGAGFVQTSWSNAPVTRALIGAIEGDRLVETLLVEAGPWVNEIAGVGDETTVFDQPAQIYRDADLSPNTSTVVWGENPVLSVQGLNPMAFLQRASADFVVASSVDGAASITSLEFGELPDGWEVIVEPSPLRRGAVTAQMSTGEGGLSLEVTTENPMLTATTGSYERVDVNGRPGWQYDRARHPVIWSADATTFVTVFADSPERALTAARALEFVGAGAWMDTYGVEFPIFPPDAPAQAPPTQFETTVP